MGNNIRGFHRLSKAWYTRKDNNLRPEISFGIYDEDGQGCTGEMIVEWEDLPSHGKPVPKLNIFDDAWGILAGMKDLVDELGRNCRKNISEEEFAGMLICLGFKDMTEYEAPERYRKPEKKISFIDTAYNPLFSVKDGGEIESENRGTGEWDRQTCVFIDENHFRIAGGETYHIYQFAELMERHGRRFRLPEKPEGTE
jgi:hypothetical protein